MTAMTVYRARQALVLEGMEAALQRKPRPPNATGNFIQARVIQEIRRIPRPVAPDFVFK